MCYFLFNWPAPPSLRHIYLKCQDIKTGGCFHTRMTHFGCVHNVFLCLENLFTALSDLPDFSWSPSGAHLHLGSQLWITVGTGSNNTAAWRYQKDPHFNPRNVVTWNKTCVVNTALLSISLLSVLGRSRVVLHSRILQFRLEMFNSSRQR